MRRRFLIEAFKNSVIFLLVLLSIVQTGTIWFDGRSFLEVFSLFDTANNYKPTAEELNTLQTPTRALARADSERFYSSYTQSELDIQREFLLTLLDELNKNGEYSPTDSEDICGILSEAKLIYQYEFSMPTEVLITAFGIKSSQLSSRIQNVDFIAVSDSDNRDGVVLHFISSSDGTHTKYTLRSESLCGLGDEYAARLNSTGANLYYVMEGDSVRKFSDDSFIADWNGEFSYLVVNAINPFAEYESVPLPSVQKKVAGFFENSGTIFSDIRNGSYMYSGGQVVVKYTAEGLLDYTYFGTLPSKATDSFISSFSAALRMLKKDTNIANELYLSKYSHDGDTWIFSFDALVSDFQLFLSNKLKAELGINHLIEVTVKSDTAINYKRYVISFEPDPSFFSTASTTFNDIRSEMPLPSAGSNDTRISGLKLGYRIDGGSQLGLYWSMLISDKDYVIPLQ